MTDIQELTNVTVAAFWKTKMEQLKRSDPELVAIIERNQAWWNNANSETRMDFIQAFSRNPLERLFNKLTPPSSEEKS